MEVTNELLKKLCIEIATGDVGSELFTQLLLETGIRLDDREWDAANRVLVHSECMMSTYPVAEITQH